MQAEIHACIIFPKKYGLMDIFAFDVILNTWSKIERPPNPSKNEHRIIDILLLYVVIYFRPFVTSINPITIPLEYFSGILRICKTG